jgi:hypothetical protein
LTSVIIDETVSRREVREARTDLRSWSRVVAGAAVASVAGVAEATEATGATGVATGTATAVAVAVAVAVAFLATRLAGVSVVAATGAGVAATGAGAGAGAAASSVFLATRLPLVEAVAEFIILVPVEEFISIKRTEYNLAREASQFFADRAQLFEPESHGLTFFFEVNPGDDRNSVCV